MNKYKNLLEVLLWEYKLLPTQQKVFDLIIAWDHRWIWYYWWMGCWKSFLWAYMFAFLMISCPWIQLGLIRENLWDLIKTDWAFDIFITIMNDVIKKFWLDPDNAYKWDKKRNTFRLANWSILLLFHGLNPMNLRWMQFHGVWIDEINTLNYNVVREADKRIRSVCKRKYLKNYFFYWSSNPNSYDDWFYFMNEKEKDWKINKKKISVKWITKENTHLPEDYAENIQMWGWEEELEMYVKGNFVPKSEIIFYDFFLKEWKLTFHNNIFEEYKVKGKSYEVIAWYDHWTVSPSCFILWLQDLETNKIYIQDMLYLKHSTISMTALAIKGLYNRYNLEFNRSIIKADPAIFYKNQNSQYWIVSVSYYFINEWIIFSKAKNNINSFIDVFKDLYLNNMIMFNSNNCVELLKQIKKFRWKKDKHWKPQEVPADKQDDHALDAFKYSFIHKYIKKLIKPNKVKNSYKWNWISYNIDSNEEFNWENSIFYKSKWIFK